jgi:hypothetical protein
MVQHDLAVSGACHQRDAGVRESRAQCPEEGDNAEHVAKLVVLTNNQNPSDVRGGGKRPLSGADEAPQDGGHA